MANTLDGGLFWTPHAKISEVLKHGSYVNSGNQQKALDRAFQWLFSTLDNFKPPNDRSRKVVSDCTSVSLGDRQTFQVEPKLRTATAKAAKLLVRKSTDLAQPSASICPACLGLALTGACMP